MRRIRYKAEGQEDIFLEVPWERGSGWIPPPFLQFYKYDENIQQHHSPIWQYHGDDE